jgi:hypothetical protein
MRPAMDMTAVWWNELLALVRDKLDFPRYLETESTS